MREKLAAEPTAIIRAGTILYLPAPAKSMTDFNSLTSFVMAFFRLNFSLSAALSFSRFEILLRVRPKLNISPVNVLTGR